MDKVIYAKYNLHRAPWFQTITLIMQDEAGQKKVVKKASAKDSLQHIRDMKEKGDMLNEVYRKIEPVDCFLCDGVAEFPYLEGENLVSETTLDFEDIHSVYEILQEKMKMLFDVKESYKCDFILTEEYSKVFHSVPVTRTEAIRFGNIDSILSNFIKVGQKVYCIDYEWVFSFPIPLFFLKYRLLHDFYINHSYKFAQVALCEQAFMENMGISREEYILSEEMENDFQDYVHGKNRSYMYLARNAKKEISGTKLMEEFRTLENDYGLKNTHIENLETLVKELRDMNELKDRQIRELQEIIATLSEKKGVSKIMQKIRDKFK